MNALTFAHPGLLLGLAAAALPAAIHLVGRRHAPVVAFSALEFLQALDAHGGLFERLRQWLLLLVRTLAVVALVLALAGPRPREAAPTAAGVRRVALIVDTSASMAYVHGGQSLLARAVQQASDVLGQLGPADAATLITAGGAGRAHVLAPTTDFAAVRGALAGLRTAVPEGTADMPAAVRQAAQQLGLPAGADAGPQGEIFIFGDLARNSFVGSAGANVVHAGPLRLVDAATRAKAGPLGNLAIVDAQVRPAGPQAGLRERQVHVRLHNYGAQAVLARAIVLGVDGSDVLRGTVDAAPGADVHKVLTYTFATPGSHTLVVRLGADAADGYAADDAWHGQADITPAVQVLAVDGEPRGVAYEDELFFLERALASVPEGEAPIAVHGCAPADLAAALAAEPRPDAVVLAHLTAMASDQVQALQAYVAAGGGLLITLGRHTDFEAANAQLGSLLPHPLRDLTRAGDLGAAAAVFGLNAFDWTHPVLKALGGGAESSLRHSRTAQYFNLDVGAQAATRVLLGFDNGAPALCERQAGAGRVLLWTSSIDVDLTDLPLRSAFVPLMQASVRYLGHALPAPVAQGAQPHAQRLEESDFAPVQAAEVAAALGVSEDATEMTAGNAAAHAGHTSPIGTLWSGAFLLGLLALVAVECAVAARG